MKRSVTTRFFCWAGMLVFWNLSFCSCTQRQKLDAASLPLISEQEMGQLRWVLKLAQQPLDDFSNFESENQHNLTAYRYSIAFSVYFLAAEQYHKLPAWSEVIQPAMDRLIEKLLQKPVWDYWATTSRGVPNLEPAMDQPYPERHDPVGDMNIMYSGHVGHTLNLYQMLYRDFKWDEPGSMVFSWSEQEKYPYDNFSLQDAMYQQMKNNPYHAICCEPNAVFPECNQHAVLSFMLYDYLHDSQLFKASEGFFDFFVQNQLIDPDTREVAMIYLVKQGWTVSQKNPRYGNLVDGALQYGLEQGIVTLESASADGWTGAFMHAWQPKFIEEQYPFWKKNRFVDNNDGTAELKWESWEPMVQVGFFAVLAAEMGDVDALTKLLAFADAHYQPVWQEGTYHYPRNAVAGCTHLTDKLMALARALPRDGLLLMHLNPFDRTHFEEPTISGVDFPNVLVRRAIYDRRQKALFVNLSPGLQQTGITNFEIHQLDANRSYRLRQDGVEQNLGKGQTSVTIQVDASDKHEIILY